MEVDWKPGDNEARTVLEVHCQPAAPANRQEALLVIPEEGVVPEGVIPDSHKRIFAMTSESNEP